MALIDRSLLEKALIDTGGSVAIHKARTRGESRVGKSGREDSVRDGIRSNRRSFGKDGGFVSPQYPFKPAFHLSASRNAKIKLPYCWITIFSVRYTLCVGGGCQFEVSGMYVWFYEYFGTELYIVCINSD